MKISQVIAQLKEVVDKYGDLPVSDLDAELGKGAEWKVTPLDEWGVDIEFSNEEKPVEVFLESIPENE